MVVESTKNKGKRNAPSVSSRAKGKQRTTQEKKSATSKSTKEAQKVRHSDRMVLDFDLDDDDDDTLIDALLDSTLQLLPLTGKKSNTHTYRKAYVF